jgi:hypothetical protein
MRTHVLLAAVLVASVSPATALAKGKLVFEHTVPAGRSSSVTITTHRAASFRVVLRVPKQGRAELVLVGRTELEKGRFAIDVKTYTCDGAPGSAYCRGAYKALPKGTYTWQVRWLGKRPAHFELTVLW